MTSKMNNNINKISACTILYKRSHDSYSDEILASTYLTTNNASPTEYSTSLNKKALDKKDLENSLSQIENTVIIIRTHHYSNYSIKNNDVSPQ